MAKVATAKPLVQWGWHIVRPDNRSNLPPGVYFNHQPVRPTHIESFDIPQELKLNATEAAAPSVSVCKYSKFSSILAELLTIPSMNFLGLCGLVSSPGDYGANKFSRP